MNENDKILDLLSSCNDIKGIIDKLSNKKILKEEKLEKFREYESELIWFLALKIFIAQNNIIPDIIKGILLFKARDIKDLKIKTKAIEFLDKPDLAKANILQKDIINSIKDDILTEFLDFMKECEQSI